MVGAALPSLGLAQETAKQKQNAVEASDELPAPPAPDSTSTAAESPQTASPPASAPKSPVIPAADSDFWAYLNKLDPQRLWKENGIVAWACLLGFIFAGMVLGKIVSVLLIRVASNKDGAISKSLSDMAGPANLALITLGIYAGLRWLTLGDTLAVFSAKTTKLLFTIAIYWYLNNLIGMVDPLLHRLSRNSASALDKHVAPLVRRSLRVFLIILTVMYVLKDVFDKDIGAWLAGLGIAGIAVSLAAQGFAEKPFRLDHHHSRPAVQNRRPDHLHRLRRGHRGYRLPLDQGPHDGRASGEHPQRQRGE